MKAKHIIIILVTWAIIALIIISPDDSRKENQKDAIELCRNYAHDLLLSRGKDRLLRLSIGMAYNKITETSFQEYFFETTEKAYKTDIRDINRIDRIIYISPLLHGYDKRALRLLSFEELGRYYMVMTFAYINDLSKDIVQIPNKGIMIFTIGVRYYAPIDNNFIRKIIRKIGNLPLLRLFTGYMGTTGRWRVVNFKYSCNLNDYEVWVKKALQNVPRTDKNKEGVIAKDFFDSIRESMEKRGEYLHNWIDLSMIDQQEKIMKLHIELDLI